MNLNNLPEVSFTDCSIDTVEQEIFDLYKKFTGRTLATADPVRLFILTIAYVVVMLLNKINETGKQNMVRYATGGNLDNLAAFYGVERIPGTAAKVTEEFTLSAAMPFNVVIPKGTRVSSGGQVYFATGETLVIKTGDTQGKVS